MDNKTVATGMLTGMLTALSHLPQDVVEQHAHLILSIWRTWVAHRIDDVWGGITFVDINCKLKRDFSPETRVTALKLYEGLDKKVENMPSLN